MRSSSYIKSILLAATVSHAFIGCSGSGSQTKNTEARAGDSNAETNSTNTEQRFKVIALLSKVGKYLKKTRDDFIKDHPRLEIDQITIKQNIQFADGFIGYFENDDTPRVAESAQRTQITEETRIVDILKPKSINEDTKVIVSLHGFMTDSISQAYYFGFQKDLDVPGENISLAEKLNAIVLMPAGLKDRPQEIIDGKPKDRGAHFWSTGEGEACCNFWQVKGGKARIDGDVAPSNETLTLDYDIDFVETAVKAALEKYTNNGEVYIIGHSNGAFLAHKIACNSDLNIKGLVALAGTIPNDTSMCKNYEGMSILHAHGTKDTIIDYEAKEPLFQGWDIVNNKPQDLRYVSAKATYDNYLDKKECESASQRSTFQTRGKNYLAPLLRIAKNETEAIYRNCGEDRVGLWTIKDGSHIPLFFGTLKTKSKVKLNESFIYRAMEFVTGGDFEMAE